MCSASGTGTCAHSVKYFRNNSVTFMQFGTAGKKMQIFARKYVTLPFPAEWKNRESKLDAAKLSVPIHSLNVPLVRNKFRSVNATCWNSLCLVQVVGYQNHP